MLRETQLLLGFSKLFHTNLLILNYFAIRDPDTHAKLIGRDTETMTWMKRFARLAIVAAILGVLAVSAGADWLGGATVITTTSASHGNSGR